VVRGAWVDPRAGQVTFERYSRQGLAMRRDPRPRTRELCISLLRLHLVPTFGRSLEFERARLLHSSIPP
jgi:hypothetical protein